MRAHAVSVARNIMGAMDIATKKVPATNVERTRLWR